MEFYVFGAGLVVSGDNHPAVNYLLSGLHNKLGPSHVPPMIVTKSNRLFNCTVLNLSELGWLTNNYYTCNELLTFCDKIINHNDKSYVSGSRYKTKMLLLLFRDATVATGAEP